MKNVNTIRVTFSMSKAAGLHAATTFYGFYFPVDGFVVTIILTFRREELEEVVGKLDLIISVWQPLITTKTVLFLCGP